MKILHVITSLAIGGAPRLLTDLIPYLAKTDEVNLLVYEREDNAITKIIESAGVKIISLD